MLSRLLKRLHFGHGTPPPAKKGSELAGSISADICAIKQLLNDANDLVIRELDLSKKIRAALLFIDSLNTHEIITQSVIQPLVSQSAHERLAESTSTQEILRVLRYGVLSVGEVSEHADLVKIRDKLLLGDSILLLDRSKVALCLGTRSPEYRELSEPQSEVMVRGPHEGFSESIRTNIGLLRRRLKDPRATFDMLVVGERTKNEVAVVYLSDIAPACLVDEVKRRVNKIRIDSVLDSGYVEQFIEDSPYSPFATVGNSERADTVIARILEGRVAILIEGTPVALIVPMFFLDAFQVPEDYYSRPYYVSIVRLVRFVGYMISLLGPAVYVALASFHQELIPTPLLVTMASAAEGTPLPSIAEALIMGLVFEILREAGIRLPKSVGQAISIVGTLVIGQAAIQAGFVSAPIVIVIAITALSSFLATPHTDSTVIFRLTYTVLSGFLGLFGIFLGLIATVIHLCSLEPFGYSYMSPIAPFSKQDLRDSLVRLPLWALKRRPSYTAWKNPIRIHIPSDDEEEPQS